MTKKQPKKSENEPITSIYVKIFLFDVQFN